MIYGCSSESLIFHLWNCASEVKSNGTMHTAGRLGASVSRRSHLQPQNYLLFWTFLSCLFPDPVDLESHPTSPPSPSLSRGSARVQDSECTQHIWLTCMKVVVPAPFAAIGWRKAPSHLYPRSSMSQHCMEPLMGTCLLLGQGSWRKGQASSAGLSLSWPPPPVFFTGSSLWASLFFVLKIK